MKKNFFKFMAACLMGASVIALPACGDDDDNGKDEPVVPQNKIATVVVDYSVSLSEDYYDLWDIEVTYTDAGGQKTERIEMDWNYQMKLNALDQIPETYGLTVTAKPKAALPSLIADQVYTLSSDCYMKIQGIGQDGKVVKTDGMLTPLSKSISTDGNHLLNVVSNPRPICSVSYDFPLN